MTVPDARLDHAGISLIVTISVNVTVLALAAIVIYHVQRMKYRSDEYSDDVMLAAAERRRQQHAMKGGFWGAMHAKHGGPKPNAMGGTTEPKGHLVGLPKTIIQGGGGAGSSGVEMTGRVGRGSVGVAAATAKALGGGAAAGRAGLGAVSTPYYSAWSSEMNLGRLSTAFDSTSADAPLLGAGYASSSEHKSSVAEAPADTDTHGDQTSNLGGQKDQTADDRGLGGRFWRRVEDSAIEPTAAAAAAAASGQQSGGAAGHVAESANCFSSTAPNNSPFAVSEPAVLQLPQQQLEEGGQRHEEIEVNEGLAPYTSRMGMEPLSNPETSFGALTELPSSEYESPRGVATPPEVYEALRQLTDITKERFASPLNYNPTFTMYWSAHKRDQIFGAKWDSYRYRWTGGSVHNPEYEDEDLNKNMATAIAAARNTTAPVFGIHILPAWSDANRTAYLAWLQHFPENCMHLLQIPRKHFRFQKPTTWERGDMYAGNPRWDVNIIVTGNAKGFEAHLPYWESGYMTRFLQTLQDAINQSLPDDKEIQDISMYYNPPSSNAPPSTSHQPTLLTPKQLSKMGYPKQTNGSESLRDDSATSQDPPAMVDASTTLDDLETQLATALPTAPPLRYNWKNYAYTDGSYKQTNHKTSPMDAECDAPGIGAGVYFPPQAANEDDERGVPIVPAGDSHPQNTINRAELVGILAALRHGAHMIATDSLSSMYQIKKMLRRPQDLLNHQHCELIKEIVTEIVNRGLRTTLHKVKGHASIIGNERADAIAKAAATGDTSDYEECEKYESPSNNRLTQYWPHKTQWNNRWSRTNNGQRTLIDRFKRVNPLTDLHDSVRHYCHQKSRFGMANRATCYFEAFKRIEERLDLPASNEYMTPSSGKIKYAERKTALRYRYGTMWTRKMAYRCGHAPSSKCLLCGDEDGGHHTASGCPALKRMYINRHNKVGRLIMTRVLRGRKGAFVIQMDLGSTENCAEDGIMAHQSRNIPWELLPRGLKEAVQQAQGTTDKRPDGMLYKPKNGNNPAEYWIIEVKICRDSDPTGQQSKADYQHQVLIDKIKDIDPTAKVWYYPLLVGVAGTIYNSTTMNLQALPLGQALKQCISEVHTAAVKSLHSIYTTKRKLEKPKKPQWHRRNYKKVS